MQAKPHQVGWSQTRSGACHVLRRQHTSVRMQSALLPHGSIPIVNGRLRSILWLTSYMCAGVYAPHVVLLRRRVPPTTTTARQALLALRLGVGRPLLPAASTLSPAAAHACQSCCGWPNCYPTATQLPPNHHQTATQPPPNRHPAAGWEVEAAEEVAGGRDGQALQAHLYICRKYSSCSAPVTL